MHPTTCRSWPRSRSRPACDRIRVADQRSRRSRSLSTCSASSASRARAASTTGTGARLTKDSFESRSRAAASHPSASASSRIRRSRSRAPASASSRPRPNGGLDLAAGDDDREVAWPDRRFECLGSQLAAERACARESLDGRAQPFECRPELDRHVDERLEPVGGRAASPRRVRCGSRRPGRSAH